MVAIFSPHWNGWSGYTQGVIAGTSRLSGIDRGPLALQSDIPRQVEDNLDPQDFESRWRAESNPNTSDSFPIHIQSKWD